MSSAPQDHDRLEQLRMQLDRAIEIAQSLDGGDRILECLDQCQALLAGRDTALPSGAPGSYDGYLDHTFADESCAPYGRDVDVRVYFDWRDYDSRDEPFAVWGAEIVGVELRGIRYFDQHGNVMDPWRSGEDLAWKLVEEQSQLLCERFLTVGRADGAVAANPLVATDPQDPVLDAGQQQLPRMSPSARQRRAYGGERNWG